GEGGSGEPRSPVAWLLQANMDIRLFEAHRIGGDFWCARAAHDIGDFGNGMQPTFDAKGRRDGLAERDPREPARLDEEPPFIELGHELRAELREEHRRAGEGENTDRKSHPAVAQRASEQRNIEPMGLPQQPRLGLTGLWPNE